MSRRNRSVVHVAPGFRYGLTAGTTTLSATLVPHRTMLLRNCSCSVVALLAAQNCFSRPSASSGRRRNNVDQTMAAQMAPPEVR